MKKALLVGLGLDNKDGHLRITRGENFRVLGGSEETHEYLQEKCIKFNERLRCRGKSLDEIDKKDFFSISAEIGMAIPKKDEEKI